MGCSLQVFVTVHALKVADHKSLVQIFIFSTIGFVSWNKSFQQKTNDIADAPGWFPFNFVKRLMKKSQIKKQNL